MSSLSRAEFQALVALDGRRVLQMKEQDIQPLTEHAAGQYFDQLANEGLSIREIRLKMGARFDAICSIEQDTREGILDVTVMRGEVRVVLHLCRIDSTGCAQDENCNSI